MFYPGKFMRRGCLVTFRLGVLHTFLRYGRNVMCYNKRSVVICLRMCPCFYNSACSAFHSLIFIYSVVNIYIYIYMSDFVNLEGQNFKSPETCYNMFKITKKQQKKIFSMIFASVQKIF